MRTRSIVALSAALTLTGGPVLAAAGDAADGPAAGAATSSLTLLDVGLGGKKLSVLELALRSDSLAGVPTTSFVVTPLTFDGTTYGRQSLSSRSATLPAIDSRSVAPAEVSAVAGARSPQIAIRSEGGSSSAEATSLGALSVLGLPLAVDGAVSISAGVDGDHATGGKTLTVTGLALPSLADLIAAFGLDAGGLPTDSLTGLLDGLDLTTPVTDAAADVLDKALAPVQPQVDAATSLLEDADAAVRTATGDLAEAQAALAAATTSLNDAAAGLTGTTAGLRIGSLIAIDPVLTAPVLTAPIVTAPVVTDPIVTAPVVTDPVVTNPLPTAPVVTDPVQAVDDGVQQVEETVDPVLGDVTDPVTAPIQETVDAILTAPDLSTVPVELQPLVDVYTAAKKAYDDAQALLATANTLLADVKAALDTLLAPYQPQIDALVKAVVGVLDSTPLLSLDRLEVTTQSVVTSAAPGGQSAKVVGGEVEGLRVLGTDVLDAALGSTQVDVLDLAGPVKAQVDAAVSGLTATVSDVLSQVPGLPALQVPAPKVDLLTRATSTSVVDGFGVAGSALRAVTVSWPGLRIPAEVALPGAATLPAVTGLPSLDGGLLKAAAVGDVLTQPLTLGIATLEDRARFRPAQTSVSPTDPGTAPGTDTGTSAPGTSTPGTGTTAPGGPGTVTPGAGTPTASTPGQPRTTPVGLTQLPRTGNDSTTPLLALVLVAGALALHRRSRTT